MLQFFSFFMLIMFDMNPVVKIYFVKFFDKNKNEIHKNKYEIPKNRTQGKNSGQTPDDSLNTFQL